MADDGYQVPPGIIAITSYGSVRPETAQSLLDLKDRARDIGLTNVQFQFVIATLVDKARNDAVEAMLANPANGWLWFIDADMIVPKEALDHILVTAFRDCPWADIVGGYCQLRGDPFLPTIDTGSGLWESHLPGQGALEVIRTGGACTLIKRQVFEKMAYPWYGIRPAATPLDMLAEVDNFARIKFDGRNPFSGMKEWQQLIQCARDDQPIQQGKRRPNTVGEDSNFTDRAKALGFRIVVQTNAVIGHVDKKVIWPQDHAEAMKRGAKFNRLAVGVTR